MFDAHQFIARLADQQDRWSLLQDFVAEWSMPVRSSDGCTPEEIDAAERRLGFTLPLALRELHEFAGKHFGVAEGPLSNLLSLDDLVAESKFIMFYRECQDVVDWYIKLADIGLADPPVYVDTLGCGSPLDAHPEMYQENSTVSEFILQMTLTNVILAHVYSDRWRRGTSKFQRCTASLRSSWIGRLALA